MARQGSSVNSAPNSPCGSRLSDGVSKASGQRATASSPRRGRAGGGGGGRGSSPPSPYTARGGRRRALQTPNVSSSTTGATPSSSSSSTASGPGVSRAASVGKPEGGVHNPPIVSSGSVKNASRLFEGKEGASTSCDRVTRYVTFRRLLFGCLIYQYLWREH